MHAEQHARNPVARQRTADLPQSFAQRAAQRHADRPAILNPHQVLTDGVAIPIVQIAQPVADRFDPTSRAIEHDRNLAWRVSHAGSYIVHGPWNVPNANSQDLSYMFL